MIVVGIPMYVCATASIPIAVTLMIKGFSPGVAFVFLVVGPVTNAASFTIIMNVLGKKLSLIYLIIVSIFAIIFGYMLDGIIEIFDINVLSHIQHLHDHSTVGGLWFQYSIGVVFFIMLAMSLYRKLLPSKLKSFINNLFQFDRVENVKEGIPFDPPFSKHQRDKVEMELKYSGEQGEMNLKYEDGSMYKVKIEGMTCNHCVMNVRQAITAVEGVESVDVILSDKAAYIKGKFNFDELKKNVEAVGYRIV
jgi:copper chaperone CopZ